MRNFDLTPFQPVYIDDLLRLGKDNDGGYVVPGIAVSSSTALLSLGVNLDWSFEESMLEMRPGLKLLCVDGTTGLGRAITKTFQKIFDFLGHLITLNFIKAKNDFSFLATPIRFYKFFSKYPLLKLMVGEVNKEGYIDIDQLIARYFPKAENIFIKMDIEGGEYEVLPIAPSVSRSLSGLVIEFHSIDKNWTQFQMIMLDLMESFYVAHIHGNNYQSYISGTKVPQTVEVTFISKKFFQSKPPLSDKVYPVEGLDMPCNPKHPDLSIAFSRQSAC